MAAISSPRPRPLSAAAIHGEVVFIDEFGNLITNIPADMIRNQPRSLKVGKQIRKRFAWVRTYGEAKPGTLVALLSSDGWLEIAVVNGSAAHRLRAAVGTLVSIDW